jgi:hypothetical protein
MNGYAVTSASKYAEESDFRQMAVPNKKVKKVGFFKRWLLKSLNEAADSARNNSANLISEDIISSKQLRSISGISAGPAQIDQPERALQFTVYSASGGRIIETRKYDRKTDRSMNGLYIITNDQDFGREIDKIITMEALK